MLLNSSNSNNGACSEQVFENPKRLSLPNSFLTTSTATRSQLQESTEKDNVLLSFSDEPLLQPKKRLPLNMVISAMAERKKSSTSEVTEANSIFAKIKKLKENADITLPTPKFLRRCKRNRLDILSQTNSNHQQIHTKHNSASNTERLLKQAKYYESPAVYQSNLYGQNSCYSTPCAKSRFQQLYGNGCRTDYHCSTDNVATDGLLLPPTKYYDHPHERPAVYQSNLNGSSTCQNRCYSTPCAKSRFQQLYGNGCRTDYHCSTDNVTTDGLLLPPTVSTTPECKTRRHQPFVTSQDLLQYAAIPEEAHTFTNSNFPQETEPTTCFRVTYTKKDITYLKKRVQSNINITESHYEFIFEPKVLNAETGEYLSIPDLLSQ